MMDGMERPTTGSKRVESQRPGLRWARLVRPACATLGGYFLAKLLAMLLGLALAFAGMSESEAVVTASMLSFLLYLSLLVWGFAGGLLWPRLLVLGLLPALLWPLLPYIARTGL